MLGFGLPGPPVDGAGRLASYCPPCHTISWVDRWAEFWRELSFRFFTRMKRTAALALLRLGRWDRGRRAASHRTDRCSSDFSLNSGEYCIYADSGGAVLDGVRAEMLALPILGWARSPR